MKLSICTLHIFDFHPKWIALIKACMSVVSYSVIMNVDVCGFFSPTRGIRQEDPLSPYLFIICIEVLTGALQKTPWRKKCRIRSKLSPRPSKIPCFLFAGDSLLFYRTNLESCQEISLILNQFCQSSYHPINFQKSSLTFSRNAKAHNEQSVSSIFNIMH